MTEVAVLTPDPADPSYAGQWPGVLDRLAAGLATAGITARPTPWTDHVESAHGLMERSDSALYVSKRSGRNRVTSAETVRIDMAGGFDSLNVATTSGIALYELTRQMTARP